MMVMTRKTLISFFPMTGGYTRSSFRYYSDIEYRDGGWHEAAPVNWSPRRYDNFSRQRRYDNFSRQRHPCLRRHSW